MTKITLNNVADLTQATTAALVINNNSDTIETAFDNTLSRDGTAPNSMRASIDMDSNRVLNLPSPVSVDEPLRLQDLSDFIGSGTISTVPSGGNTGDVLAKNSNADYDIEWVSDSALVIAGTNLQASGTSPVTLSTVTNPNFAGNVTIGGSLSVGSFGVNTLTLNGATSGSTVLTPAAVASGTLTLPAATDTLVGKATTDTLTNKTLTSPVMTAPTLGAASGTSLNLSGLTASSAVATNGSKDLVSVTNTGTGNNVLATTPTLTTPVLGVATATTINGNALTAGTGTLNLGTATLAVTNGGTLTGSSSAAIFYDNIPQNSQSTAYGLVLSDAQKHILHPTADNNARTFTIPANSSVAYPIGTVITFVNQINTVTIAITTDTMTLAGAGTTGSRTLAASGIATALKIGTTSWIISGNGLT